MEETRKALLVAGLYLGDVNLALASFASELPSYVKGVDPGSLLEETSEVEALRQRAEDWLRGGIRSELDSEMLRAILERAISSGRYLSAIRCLEMLGERDAYIEGCLKQAEEALRERDFQRAAHFFVIAASLDLTEGFPLWQYKAAELHDRCIQHPEECITRMSLEKSAFEAIRYLLGSERVSQRLEGFKPEIQQKLLPWIGSERDPHAATFISDFARANEEIEDVSRHLLDEVSAKLEMISKAVRQFRGQVEGVAGGSNPMVGKIRRIAEGLVRDFEPVGDLIRDWQLVRIRRRLERLIDTERELGEALERIEKGSTLRASSQDLMELSRKVEEEGIVARVEEIQTRLLETQATMLGRKVHSQEHWQFLREIGFKYPVAPLMCCLRKLNDRWLVVPVWDSPLVALLREHLASESGGKDSQESLN